MSDREVRELLVEGARTVRAGEAIHRIENLGCPSGIAVQRQVSFYELSVYMHDQLLRDTDQMSMAHALEVRVPLIGRRVVEAVAGLGHRALAGAHYKALLRRILATYLPGESFRGPKQGFTLNWERLLAGQKWPPGAGTSRLFRQEGVALLWKQFRNQKSGFGPPFAVGAIESCGRALGLKPLLPC